MTHENEGNYAAKHSPESNIAPHIMAAINNKISDGKIACAALHSIAKKFNISPAEID